MGNSGVLLNASHGADIDAHEAVFRMNRARVHNHERDLGHRTTLQIMHAGMFRFCESKEAQCDPGDERCECVPNGDGTAITVAPTEAGQMTAAQLQIARLRRPHTPFLRLSDMHIGMCHLLVRQYATLRLGAAGAGGEEAWKEEEAVATTGLVAVIASLALCDRVSTP